MSGHLLVAFTNPADGCVEECTSWYRDVHLDEALATPGFETGQLLTRSADQLPEDVMPPSEHHFLAVYTISSTPEKLVRTTGRYLAEGYAPPPFLARGGGGPWIYTAIGERIGSSLSGDHLVVALSNPIEGRDDEFNDWHTSTHLLEVSELPGFASAQRFRIDDVQMPLNVAQPSPYRYLAIYEVTGTAAAARDLILNHEFTPTDAVDTASARTWSYTSIARRGSFAAAA